jgi:hypothetical protein
MDRKALCKLPQEGGGAIEETPSLLKGKEVKRSTTHKGLDVLPKDGVHPNAIEHPVGSDNP